MSPLRRSPLPSLGSSSRPLPPQRRSDSLYFPKSPPRHPTLFPLGLPSAFTYRELPEMKLFLVSVRPDTSPPPGPPRVSRFPEPTVGRAGPHPSLRPRPPKATTTKVSTFLPCPSPVRASPPALSHLPPRSRTPGTSADTSADGSLRAHLSKLGPPLAHPDAFPGPRRLRTSYPRATPPPARPGARLRPPPRTGLRKSGKGRVVSGSLPAPRRQTRIRRTRHFTFVVSGTGGPYAVETSRDPSQAE